MELATRIPSAPEAKSMIPPDDSFSITWRIGFVIWSSFAIFLAITIKLIAVNFRCDKARIAAPTKFA